MRILILCILALNINMLQAQKQTIPLQIVKNFTKQDEIKDLPENLQVKNHKLPNYLKQINNYQYAYYENSTKEDTPENLYKIDSINTTLYSPMSYIPSNSAFDFAADSEGAIWMASRDGLCKWKNKEWSFFRNGYSTKKKTNQYEKVLCDNNDAKWLIEGFFRKNLLIFEQGEFTDISIGLPYYDICKDDTNNIYIGSKGYILKSKNANREFLGYTLMDNDYTLKLHKDNNNVIWSKGSTEWIYVIDKKPHTTNSLNGMDGSKIYDFCFIDSNYYAVLTLDSCFLYYDKEYHTIEFPLDPNPYFPMYNELKFSPDSLLTIATWFKGVIQYNKSEWKVINETEYYWGSDVKAIDFIGDSLLVGYDGAGLSVVSNSGTNNYFGPNLERVDYMEYFHDTLFMGNAAWSKTWDGETMNIDNPNPDYINCFSYCISPDSVLYSSTSNGIFWWENNNWENKNSTYNIEGISGTWDITFDSKKNLYAGIPKHGFVILDTLGNKTEVYEESIMNNKDIVPLIADSKDRLWMGLWELGFPSTPLLYTYENGKFTQHSLPVKKAFICDIMEANNGDIYVSMLLNPSTLSGLWKYDGENWEEVIFTDDIYITQGVNDLHQDYKGNIWGALIDLFMYNGTEWITYDNIGLPNSVIKSITSDKLGNIYIGTQEYGMYVLSADSTLVGSVPTARKLEKLKLYPNPAQDYVNIELTNEQPALIEVFDLLGKIVLKQNSKGKLIKLDIAHLPKGNYIITAKQKGVFSTQKLVKQ